MPYEGTRVVVLGTEKDHEEEFQIALCGVEGLRVAGFEEGKGVGAVFFGEFADEARCGVFGP